MLGVGCSPKLRSSYVGGCGGLPSKYAALPLLGATFAENLAYKGRWVTNGLVWFGCVWLCFVCPD